MKKVKTLAAVILAVSFFSFTVLNEKQVNVEESSIAWVGKKVTGQHNGTISLESGVLKFDDNNLTGGNFVIDMTTITVTDLEGKGKASLEGHLKSDDFFGVEKHNKAMFTITESKMTENNTYAITGDLTIKNITNPISFTMNVAGNKATAKVVVDRSKFDVRYGSPSFFNDLKDKAIYDDFELDVTLSF